jgi:hypothetical protein
MKKSNYSFIFYVFIFIVSIGAPKKSNASHLMGGNITYTYLGGDEYSINLSLFRDCTGIPLLNTTTVNVNSAICGISNVTMTLVGVPIDVTPLCSSQAQNSPCLGGSGIYGVQEWIYRGTLTLSGSCTNANDIILSWSDCCRNPTITTLTTPDSDGIYLYATLDNSLVGHNNSPAFNNKPTVFLCANQENRYNNGMTDVENDQLVYSLVDCKEDINQVVSYAGAFSGTSPLTASIANIDSETGEIIIFPTSNQVAVLCVLVEEFRNGIKIGEVVRDLQLIVTDCGGNSLPTLSGINGAADSLGTTGAYKTTACVGQQICFYIQGFDKEAVPSSPIQDLTINWNFGVNATFVVDYAVPYPVGEFCWTPTIADIGKNRFSVEAKDDACPFIGSNIYTYEIEVFDGVTANITSNATTQNSPGDTIQLMVNVNDPNATIAWFPSAGLSCTDCPNPTFIATGTNTPTSVTYTVIVTNDQGCSSGDEIVIDISPVSTQNIEELKGWDVFPNPVTSQSIIEYTLTKQSDVQLELINVVGQKVATIRNENQGNGDYQYSISNYLDGKAKGMYFIRMTINGQVAIKKLMHR